MSEKTIASIFVAVISALAALLVVFLNQLFDSVRRKEMTETKGEDKYIERKILALETSISSIESFYFDLRKAHRLGFPLIKTKEETENEINLLIEKYFDAMNPIFPFINVEHNDTSRMTAFTLGNEIKIMQIHSCFLKILSILQKEDYEDMNNKMIISSNLREIDDHTYEMLKKLRDVFETLYLKKEKKKLSFKFYINLIILGLALSVIIYRFL